MKAAPGFTWSLLGPHKSLLADVCVARYNAMRCALFGVNKLVLDLLTNRLNGYSESLHAIPTKQQGF